MPYFKVEFTVDERVSITGRADKRSWYAVEVEAENETDACEMVSEDWSAYADGPIEVKYEDEEWEEDGDGDNDHISMEIDDASEIPAPRILSPRRRACTKNRI